jgi:4-carboxymuconolactone decarboxylase
VAAHAEVAVSADKLARERGVEIVAGEVEADQALALGERKGGWMSALNSSPMRRASASVEPMNELMPGSTLAAYGGYPATQRAIRIAAEEFAKSDSSSRPRKEEVNDRDDQ